MGTEADEEEDTPRPVALLTTDFPMQNVAMYLGINLLAMNGLKVRWVKKWILRYELGQGQHFRTCVAGVRGGRWWWWLVAVVVVELLRFDVWLAFFVVVLPPPTCALSIPLSCGIQMVVCLFPGSQG